MENDIDIYNRIINFYNGPYINNKKEDYDISYNKWVKNDNNIKILCSHINIPNNEEGINKIIQRRDYPCELKLIKWITEDLEHKMKIFYHMNIIVYLLMKIIKILIIILMQVI